MTKVKTPEQMCEDFAKLAIGKIQARYRANNTTQDTNRNATSLNSIFSVGAMASALQKSLMLIHGLTAEESGILINRTVVNDIKPVADALGISNFAVNSLQGSKNKGGGRGGGRR